MARKKTHEEFVAEVKTLVGDEYTVVGEYQLYNVGKLFFQHKVCGDGFYTTPASFVKQNVRCSKCNPPRELSRKTLARRQKVYAEKFAQRHSSRFSLLTLPTTVLSSVAIKCN